MSKNITGDITNDTRERWVVSLTDVGAGDLPTVGGKGANLGVLASAGLPVPPGFCVTTAAFERFLAQDPELGARLDALEELGADDVEGVRERAGALREHLRALPVPAGVVEAVLAAWREAGESHAYAVRSSATLEDLPDASFAGQQDTYLEIRGAEAIEHGVRDCWVSLFTDRAVLYRRQHGYPSRAARLAVVVQRMVRPEVSGIMFTADPVTGHRGVCSIDASYGLGEALVSGLVDADLYRVDKATGALLEARVGAKARAIEPLREGGTRLVEVPPRDRERRCLDDASLRALVELGCTVEALQGSPQDVEWCLEGGEPYLVQARAITSLFPVPQPMQPGRPRVYFSFGHIQVNTAPMPPVAHSVVGHLMPFFKPAHDRPSTMIASAGGRIYADFTGPLLRWPLSQVIPRMLLSIEPGIARRLMVVRDRPEFRASPGGRVLARGAMVRALRRLLPRVLHRLWWAAPERARADYEAIIEAEQRSYAERFDRVEPGAPRVRAAIEALDGVFNGPLLETHFPMLMSGMAAWGLLRRVMRGRVSEATIRALSRGLPGNVTTQMDLELGDLADQAREVPALVERLRARPEAATLAEAEAYWAEHRPRAVVENPAQLDYAELDAFAAIPTATAQERAQARARFGAKTVGLATLVPLVDARYQTPGLGVPFRYYDQFMRGNAWPVDLGEGVQPATYAETIEAWLDDEAFRTDAALRKQRLSALRQHMRQYGVVSPALVEALRARIAQEFGSEAVMVRVRSSSNAEDTPTFNGAGLYDSTSACAADSAGAAGAASACDPSSEPRSLERALARVWSSLWNYGAFEEREYYQLDHRIIAMGATVSLRYEGEQANGVAFTGDPLHSASLRYTVNAQLGEVDVVSPTPGVTAELSFLTIAGGEVTEIERAVPSTLVPEGEAVVSDAHLRELGGLMAMLAETYPVDYQLDGPQAPILDLEFKVTRDDALVIKQIRTFVPVPYASDPSCRD
ncbi:MAG: hypothetical protein KDK70_03985 [Myxococcales bacterium]|nr:hypothetical protein [Myxococcales bacterium]